MVLEKNKIPEIIFEVRYKSRLNHYSGNILISNKIDLRNTLQWNIEYNNFKLRIRNINL